jgi:hypothetical protein
MPEPSISQLEVAIGKLKRCKSSGGDQIPAELIQSGVGTLHSEIQPSRWDGPCPDSGMQRRLSSVPFFHTVLRSFSDAIRTILL